MSDSPVSRRLLNVALALLAPVLAAHADVLVVDAAAGPGSDFTQIQAAVAAAADGDTLLVRNGNYAERVRIEGKSLALVADGDAVGLTAFSFFTYGFSPTITIRDLAADQEVLVRGLDLASGVAIEDCDGAVWIDEVYVGGRATCYDGGVAGAYVANCTRVTFTRCSLTGQNGNSVDSLVLPAAPGLWATSATLQLFDCQVTGGWGENAVTISINPRPPQVGGAGASIEASTVTTVGCAILGGAGGLGPPPICTSTHAPGGPGVEFVGTAATLQSTASTALGGMADLELLCPGQTGPAGPPLQGSGTIVPLPGFARHLRANSPVRGGETLTFEVEGLAGEVPLVLVSLEQAPLPLLAYGGVLLVGLPPDDVFVLPALPVGGRTTLSFAGPNVGPTVAGLNFHAQALFLAPASAVWLSGGTTLLLLDASF